MVDPEYVMLSLRVTVQEREALKKAAEKEMRSMSKYLLNSALERAKELHEIVPEQES